MASASKIVAPANSPVTIPSAVVKSVFRKLISALPPEPSSASSEIVVTPASPKVIGALVVLLYASIKSDVNAGESAPSSIRSVRAPVIEPSESTISPANVLCVRVLKSPTAISPSTVKSILSSLSLSWSIESRSEEVPVMLATIVPVWSIPNSADELAITWTRS